MTDDTLDALLTPGPLAMDTQRRQTLLQATQSQLPRSRRWATLLTAVLLFAAGAAVGWLLKPTAQVRETVLEMPALVPEVTPTPPPAPAVPSWETKPDALLTAAELDQLETAAEIADPATAAKLYRRVADEYLARSDIRSAVRCYRLHLNEAGRDGLTRTPDDSWLLVSLKTSTLEEVDR